MHVVAFRFFSADCNGADYAYVPTCFQVDRRAGGDELTNAARRHL